jgi:hypothetical protein
MPDLLPVDTDALQPGVPFADNLYNRQGVLLVSRGSVIDSPAQLARLRAQRLYRRVDHTLPAQASPLEQLRAIARHYDEALADPAAFSADTLERLARGVRHLARSHPELCVGMVPRLPMDSDARRHSLHVAIVATLLARALELDETAQQSIACAALTMNLSSHALQDTLSGGLHPDAGQQRQLLDHPDASARQLLHAGVTDPAWLQAVRQHHENLDGSGYPLGLRGPEITQEARLLRAADVWCALLAHRHNRICRYPGHALRLLFQRERGRLDDAIMLALRKLMGRYPPGTLVRLANRETALVTRWFPNRALPVYVVSLLRPSGEVLRWPERRRTERLFHAIRDYTYLPPHHADVDWARAWALA